jgi:hypothetical protein
MALRDVKEYYFKMLGQYLEMKEDLADFEQALKDGFITEEQMQAAFDEVTRVQQNCERLGYILYLFELPNKKAKKAKHNKMHAQLVDLFKNKKADTSSVELENCDALKIFREELKKLRKDENK